VGIIGYRDPCWPFWLPLRSGSLYPRAGAPARGRRGRRPHRRYNASYQGPGVGGVWPPRRDAGAARGGPGRSL